LLRRTLQLFNHTAQRFSFLVWGIHVKRDTS
jgi:hypothetical protein